MISNTNVVNGQKSQILRLGQAFTLIDQVVLPIGSTSSNTPIADGAGAGLGQYLEIKLRDALPPHVAQSQFERSENLDLAAIGGVLNPAYVADLRRIVEHPELAVEPLEPQEALVPGDEVLVRDGPLAGFRGQVIELKGARRLVVWIPSIGRGLLCTLGDAAVTRVRGAAA